MHTLKYICVTYYSFEFYLFKGHFKFLILEMFKLLQFI